MGGGSREGEGVSELGVERAKDGGVICLVSGFAKRRLITVDKLRASGLRKSVS